jgi:multiple sugar transport system permease protein
MSYNEFPFALVFTGIRTKTLPVAIAEYGGEEVGYWSLSAAATIGITLPIVLVIALVHRHLVRGPMGRKHLVRPHAGFATWTNITGVAMAA